MVEPMRERAPSGIVGAGVEEPLPLPPDEGVPLGTVAPRQWLRDNLFSSPVNSVLTVVFGLLLAWVAFRAFRFVFVTARWEIVQDNLTNFMVGRFPRDALYRPWIAVVVVASIGGLVQGMNAARLPPEPLRRRLQRAAPLIVLTVVLLSLTRTLVPLLLTVTTVVAYGAGRWAGGRLPARASRAAPVLYVAAIAAVFLAIAGFGGVGWDRWGGLLLTLNLAIAAIAVSFPIGVLLALGRRSSFPAVRVVCVAYIELIRGVPLITLLFMGSLALGFFLPPGAGRPGLVTRAIVALIAFTAAYVAEIVRGGLQGVPHGQTEAAQALGLSPVKITGLIVLPQALRNVIPALVGQFISLFKDTSLVSIIGLLELLAVAQVVPTQPAFFGQALEAETLVFVSFVYWCFCYAMSRSSQRLERRLGVGER